MRGRLLLLLMLTVVASQPALGCSCQPTPNVPEALDRSAAVFLGEVQALEMERRWVKYPDDANRVRGGVALEEHGLLYERVFRIRFTVDRSWKGIDEGTVTLYTPSFASACGIDFKLGTRYIVYAVRTESDGLAVFSCSRTAMSGTEGGDMPALGNAQRDFLPERLRKVKEALSRSATYTESGP